MLLVEASIVTMYVFVVLPAHSFRSVVSVTSFKTRAFVMLAVQRSTELVQTR